MVQNSALNPVSADQLFQVLGTEVTTTDITLLQAEIELLTITPGMTFWHSGEGRAGIYIILAGKVRLFDLQGNRVTTLTVGRSFGASTLFPDADFYPRSEERSVGKEC